MISKAEMIKIMLEKEERENKTNYKNKYKRNEDNEEYEEFCKLKEEGCKKVKKESTELYNLKKSLLSECIYKVFDKSLGIQLESQEKDVMKRTLVNNFIEEQGVDRLINEFKSKSYLLSEFARIIEETVKKAKDKCKEENSEELNIDYEIRSDFYDEIDIEDADEIANIIKMRTTSATEEFIQSNMNDKLEIKDIIRATQEKIDSAKKESVKESYDRQGKAAIAKVRNRGNKGVFESMVYAISRAALKDDTMKEMYMTENSLNMDNIVENVSIMYTFLETINTTKMINVDEKYITKVLNGFKA